MLICVEGNKESDRDRVGLGDRRPNKVTNKHQNMGVDLNFAGPSKGGEARRAGLLWRNNEIQPMGRSQAGLRVGPQPMGQHDGRTQLVWREPKGAPSNRSRTLPPKKTPATAVE